MTAELKDYADKVYALLDCYEEGRDLFKNAQKARTWDYPVIRKKEFEDDPSLPDSWLGLVEKVIGTIAKEKYDLNTYPSRIEIISADQMMDAYTSIGLPISYEHWSFGKQRIIEDKKYDAGGGLAYELVINSDPSIAYCMENNTPMMQMLVIAHACFGHNNFFKENYLFKDHTNAKTILDSTNNLKNLIRSCESQYGYEEVEKLIDACHALKLHAVSYNPHKKGEEKDREALAREQYLDRAHQRRESTIYEGLTSKGRFADAAQNHESGAQGRDGKMEENILLYIADNAPHLPTWKREIMRGIASIQQYFYPQGQTQMMNEGWASTWHYTLLHDMADLDLVTDGMMQEFLASHAHVLSQPDFDETRPVFDKEGKPVIGPDGKRQRRGIYNGINPYALGFKMFKDIKRICMEPTEEDHKWFPEIAGNEDWLGTWKFARDNFKDESFIQQYLSPQVMRDFSFFTIKDDAESNHYEIGAVQDEKGFEELRSDLAAQYRRFDMIPRIGVYRYNEKTDRSLVLHHIMQEDRPIEAQNTQAVLKHLYTLWQHPVILESVNENNVVIGEPFSVPVNYSMVM